MDETGKPNFSNADEKIIYKLSTLQGLNVYWNCMTRDKAAESLILAQKDFAKQPNSEVWMVKLKTRILLFN